MQSHELRPGKLQDEPRSNEVVESVDRERPDVHGLEPLRRQGRSQLQRIDASRLVPAGDQQADRERADAPGGEPQDVRAGRVEPLDVVDREHEHPALGEQAEGGEPCPGDGEPVGLPASLREAQNSSEGFPGGLGQQRQHLVENGLEEVAERGIGE